MCVLNNLLQKLTEDQIIEMIDRCVFKEEDREQVLVYVYGLYDLLCREVFITKQTDVMVNNVFLSIINWLSQYEFSMVKRACIKGNFIRKAYVRHAFLTDLHKDPTTSFFGKLGFDSTDIDNIDFLHNPIYNDLPIEFSVSYENIRILKTNLFTKINPDAPLEETQFKIESPIGTFTKEIVFEIDRVLKTLGRLNHNATNDVIQHQRVMIFDCLINKVIRYQANLFATHGFKCKDKTHCYDLRYTWNQAIHVDKNVYFRFPKNTWFHVQAFK